MNEGSDQPERLKLPNRFLSNLVEQRIPVVVQLKWNLAYVGIIQAFDKRLNIHLIDAEEWEGGKCAKIGDVCIRCNNVLHIRPKPDVYPPEVIPPDAVKEDEVGYE